jgi:hypothetical protein
MGLTGALNSASITAGSGTFTSVICDSIVIDNITGNIIINGDLKIQDNVTVGNNLSCSGKLTLPDIYYYEKKSIITGTPDQTLAVTSGEDVLVYTVTANPFSNHEIVLNIPYSAFFSGNVTFLYGFGNMLKISPAFDNIVVKIYKNGLLYKQTTGTISGTNSYSQLITTTVGMQYTTDNWLVCEQYIGKLSIKFNTYHSFSRDIYSVYVTPVFTYIEGEGYSNMICGIRFNSTVTQSVTTGTNTTQTEFYPLYYNGNYSISSLTNNGFKYI